MIDGIVGNNGRNPALEERKPAATKPEDRLPLREQLRQVMRENAGRLPQAKEARKPPLKDKYQCRRLSCPIILWMKSI